MMMFCTVLPSAATIPMASTNNGNAMMVSAMRPTMRSVQPPKKPAATPASPPMRKTSATERIVGDDIRAEQGGEHDQQEQPEGKSGDRVVTQHVACVAQYRDKPVRLCR